MSVAVTFELSFTPYKAVLPISQCKVQALDITEATELGYDIAFRKGLHLFKVEQIEWPYSTPLWPKGESSKAARRKPGAAKRTRLRPRPTG
jgi:hypothetical protein